MDTQTGFFEQYSANMDIHSKIFGFIVSFHFGELQWC